MSISRNSSFVTPLLIAPTTWPRSCGPRFSETSIAHVSRLRSRCVRPSRSQTSPKQWLVTSSSKSRLKSSAFSSGLVPLGPNIF